MACRVTLFGERANCETDPGARTFSQDTNTARPRAASTSFFVTVRISLVCVASRFCVIIVRNDGTAMAISKAAMKTVNMSSTIVKPAALRRSAGLESTQFTTSALPSAAFTIGSPATMNLVTWPNGSTIASGLLFASVV